jgi:hypothetical protein
LNINEKIKNITEIVDALQRRLNEFKKEKNRNDGQSCCDF